MVAERSSLLMIRAKNRKQEKGMMRAWAMGCSHPSTNPNNEISSILAYATSPDTTYLLHRVDCHCFLILHLREFGCREI